MSSYIDEKIERYFEKKEEQEQSNVIDFTSLKILPILLKKIENLENKVSSFLKEEQYDLTKRAGIRAFLNISDSTISNYLQNGTFREGYHFHRELKGSKSIITFVSGAIEEFKKSKEK